MRHGDDIVAGIDKMNLAGDAGREIRKQVESGAAEVVECHAAMQRRMALLEGEHKTCIGDPGSRKGANRSRRDRVDADTARTEIDRQITYRSFERRLGN